MKNRFRRLINKLFFNINTSIKNKRVKKRSQYEKYYFQNPELWEYLRKDSYNTEVKFIIKLLKKYSNTEGSILDVGSGTGTTCALLKKQGYVPEGIELNSKMIKYAKKHYPDIPFYQKDMKSLNLHHRFDSVICMCATFSYNLTNKDIQKTLRTFSKHLKKRGLLIIETFNPYFITNHNFTNHTRYENYKINNKQILRKKSYKLDVTNQYLLETSVWLRDNILNIDRTSFRYIFPQEFFFFLKENHFDTISIYGNYNQTNKSLEYSDKMIVVALNK